MEVLIFLLLTTDEGGFVELWGELCGLFWGGAEAGLCAYGGGVGIGHETGFVGFREGDGEVGEDGGSDGMDSECGLDFTGEQFEAVAVAERVGLVEAGGSCGLGADDDGGAFLFEQEGERFGGFLGFVVDENITMGNLKWTLEYFLEKASVNSFL